jgi:DNA-binding NarL/FixJ family response regulator
MERISRLLAMLVVGHMKHQSEQIATLGACGFSAAEIASLLRTTRNTVSVSLSNLKRKTR